MNSARTALILMFAIGVTLVVVFMHPIAPRQPQQRVPAIKKITVSPKPVPPPVPEKTEPPTLTDVQQHKLERLMREHDNWKSLMSEPEFSQLFGSSWQRLIVDPAWQREFKTPAVLIRQNLGESSATQENTLVQFDFNRIFDNKDELSDFTASLLAGDQRAMGEMLTRHLWVIASAQFFSDEPITDRGMSTLARPENWPQGEAKQRMADK